MIINSLLDTDFYKLTMGQTALHQFPSTQVEYQFHCRNKGQWNSQIVKRIEDEIKGFCSLRFSSQELDYLRTLNLFKNSYLDFLKVYQPNIDHIQVFLLDQELKIQVKGPWFLTIPFEVPVLAIVNQVYFEEWGESWTTVEGQAKQRLQEKYDLLKDYGKDEFTLADFGTRRRYSQYWQEQVVDSLKALDVFVGTSNVDLARRKGLRPIGTMAHEFLMVGQALEDVPLVGFQKRMLQAWVDEYRGDLGIALTDTVGLDAFLRDFDLYFAKLYEGVRHDSGDPFLWAQKMIAHYKSLKIEPQSKTLVFSDGLSPQKALDLYHAFQGQIKLSFGIGTNFTNDIPGVEPLQIVMKIVEANGRPVAKISDSPGKGMCKDEGFLGYLKKVFSL